MNQIQNTDGSVTLSAPGGVNIDVFKSLVMSGVAFVDATVGNNATAEIGNPTKPYLTAQAAVDDEASILHVIGSVGNIAVSGALTLHLVGIGASKSVVGAITATGAVTLTGNGLHNITVASVNDQVTGTTGTNGNSGSSTGDPGQNGQPGGQGYDVECSHLTITGVVYSRGGDAGYGGAGAAGDSEINGGNGGYGGAGGDSGDITLTGCKVGSVYATGGDGGDGGAYGASGGFGDGTPGSGGNAGNGGAVVMVNVTQNNGAGRDTAPGTPGAGAAGGGNAGSNGSNGTCNIRSSDVASGTNTSDTVVASIINGVFQA